MKLKLFRRGSTPATVRLLWSESDGLTRSSLGFAAFVVVICSTVSGAAPVLLKIAVDALSGQQAPHDSPSPVLLIAIYAAAQWLMRALHEVRGSLYGLADQRMQRRLSVRLLKHVLSLPLRFHLDRETGSLVQTLSSGLLGCRILVQHLILSVLPVLIEIVTISIVFVTLDQLIFLLIIYSMLLCYGVCCIAGAIRLGHAARTASASQIDSGGLLTDGILNYEPIKAYNAESAIERRLDTVLARTEKNWRLFYLRKLNSGVLAAAIFTIALGSSLLIAARNVTAGTLSIGEFVLVQTYLLQLAISFELIGFAVRDISQGLAFLNRMNDLFREEPEEQPRTRNQNVSPTALGGELAFDTVSFSYHKNSPVLSDVTFSIAAGKRVAIVGPSGSGKSSLARLILRFCDPDSGQIMLDNVSISDIPHHALRNLVGLVPQDTSLLNGSIAFNISIGRSGSTQEQIVEAAKAACLHDFVVTQTDGYATKVGERGLRLSGGERQRIAIARALLRHPRVLVLDEATSSLDPTTERRVCQRMRRALRNVTEVIIAHRLSTVVDVDEILVLDKGRIIERGTHTMLVRGDGLYADMWSAQQRVARGTIGQ